MQPAEGTSKHRLLNLWRFPHLESPSGPEHVQGQGGDEAWESEPRSFPAAPAGPGFSSARGSRTRSPRRPPTAGPLAPRPPLLPRIASAPGPGATRSPSTETSTAVHPGWDAAAAFSAGLIQVCPLPAYSVTHMCDLWCT